MKLSLNPQYAIRNDAHCSYLIKKDMTDARIDKLTFNKIPTIIQVPPLVGHILSAFNNKEVKEVVALINKTTGVNRTIIDSFILKLIDNESCIKMSLPTGVMILPPYVLTSSKKCGRISFSKDTLPSNKYVLARPSVPLFITIMITSKCQTDCVYCYADRSRKDDMEINTILKTIDEAWDLGVLWVNISGGDIFAINGWKDVLKKLSDYNFKPFLSTKIPLEENDVIFLKNLGFDNIQYSIDSFNEKELLNIVKRDGNYAERIKKTFDYLQKHGITLGIRSVLTKHNISVKSVSTTLSILEQYDHIIESWDITPAFYSAFKGTYENYRPSDESLLMLFEYFSKIKSTINIGYNAINDKLLYQTPQFESIERFICKNKTCIANTYSMFILSNGAATLCELMYYNEDFYLGNINNNTIAEVWNSKRSKKISHPKQSDIVDKLNPCSSCSSFQNCKSTMERKVCYVDIINVYGKNRYDYPDPRCPMALQHNPDLMLY